MTPSIAENLLFQEKPVEQYEKDSIEHARSDADDLDDSRVLEEDTGDLVQEIVEKYEWDLPEIEATDDDVSIVRGDDVGPHIKQGRVIGLRVPYEGDTHLLSSRPGSRTVTNAPRANLEPDQIELVYETQGDVEGQFEEDIGRIEEMVEDRRNNVETFNRRLRERVREKVEERNEELADEEDIVDDLPFDEE